MRNSNFPSLLVKRGISGHKCGQDSVALRWQFPLFAAFSLSFSALFGGIVKPKLPRTTRSRHKTLVKLADPSAGVTEILPNSSRWHHWSVTIDQKGPAQALPLIMDAPTLVAMSPSEPGGCQHSKRNGEATWLENFACSKIVLYGPGPLSFM
jgi:hypothetical protein